MNSRTKAGRMGFTLVEIMIVVAIIGLLAGIAIPSFIKARNAARRNACINNLRQIDAAKDEYALEYGGDVGATVTWSTVAMYVKDITNKCYCSTTERRNRYFSSNYLINVFGIDPECVVNPGTSADPQHQLIYKAK